MKKFVWKNIVTRFGIPEMLISNNGLHFSSKAFHKYCGYLGIKNMYPTPTYPQCNREAEVTNKANINGLKKRLEGA